MTRRQLAALIEEGENLTIEFKKKFSSEEKIAKEVIAFANTRGGCIIFGVEDDGNICGVESEKGEAELVKNAVKNFCEPEISYKLFFINFGNKEVVAVEVGESDNKPHRIQDYKTKLDLNTAQVYVRVNDKSVMASKEMIKILQTRTSGRKLENYTISKNEKIVFDYLDKYEKITVKDLGGIANISNRRASRTLINLVRANLLLIHHKDNGEEYFTYSG